MYYGQSIDGKRVDEKIIELFPHLNKTNGFFIEAGAAEGIEDSSCKFFEDLGWDGINIEPFKETFDKLIQNRPKAINLHLALSNKVEEASFASTAHTFFGCGSINGPNDYLVSQLKGNKDLIVYSKVKCITYKELPIDRPVDLFVLDVEGHELKVIDGMGDTNMPDIFVIEYGHVGLKPLDEKVLGLGYKKVFVDSVNVFYNKK